MLEPNKTALEGRFKLFKNDNGEISIKIRRCPSWKGFKYLLATKGGLAYYGVALKRLRKIHYKTVEEISFNTKIPIEKKLKNLKQKRKLEFSLKKK
ncbi:hypothetical protein JW865_02580 [Candidatus Bathyarchaeota archaeon]|nr:hypothetical protein [Candidatus Bathyarchaeota archaeon]